MSPFKDLRWLPARAPRYDPIQDLEAYDEEDNDLLLDGEGKNQPKRGTRQDSATSLKTTEVQVTEKSDLPYLSDSEDEQQPSFATNTRRVAQIPWRNVVYIGLNTAATILITFLNKTVVQDDQLRSCKTSFAMYHFACTFFALSIASLPPFRLFDRVRVPIPQILPLCALFAGFLLLGNYSLQVNSIEFFTLAKMMTGPCVILLNFLLFYKTVSLRVMLSVTLLTIGVMLANGKFGLAHPFGAVVAVAAFTVTAAYQICIQKKMGDLKVSPSQLLFNQAPIAVVLLVFVVPFTDSIPNVAHIQPKTWLALLGSGAVASVINITQFLIIGATSALTFNVIGIVKVVSILVIGWIVERSWPSLLDITGAVIALGGAWMYASASSAPKSKPSQQLGDDIDDSMHEGEIQLAEVRERR